MKNNLFKWKHFSQDIILLCVRWYLKYPLSYRDLEEMMFERGIKIVHTTIMRWIHQYSPIIEETYYGEINCTTEHRMCKHLNNIIEQDHRFIKEKIDPMLGFKTLDSSDENNHRNRNYAYDTQRADQRYSVCPV